MTVLYWIDPVIWLHPAGENPKQFQFHDTIWNTGLCQQFLDHMGDDGWILATTVPYAIFYKYEEEQ